MPYRTGSYRWHLNRLAELWRPRGIYDYNRRRFKMLDWHKDILRANIRSTREALDELEKKLDRGEL